MSKQAQSSNQPGPLRATHKSAGEVTVHNIHKSGNVWFFVCEKSNGRPARLKTEQRYWISDITPILTLYADRMSGSEFRINPKLLADKVSLDEYKSARAWHAKYGKELPKVINYGRYADLVRRTLVNKIDPATEEDFDQDALSDLLLYSSPSQIESDGAEGDSNIQQDEATANERAGLLDSTEEKEGVTAEDAAEFLDYLPQASVQSEDYPEKLTPVQRLARSKMGGFLEQYFLFQDGMKCAEISSRFLKLKKRTTGGPKSWPQLVPCSAGDVRRAVEYVKKWIATLNNKAAVLSAARLELEKINKDAAWSELSRLEARKETISEPDVDQSRKRGREWATVDHLYTGSGGGGYFDYDRHLQNIFAARSLKRRESSEIPKQVKVSQPAEIENFLSSLSERVGVTRSTATPKLRATPRTPEPDLPRVWRLTPLAPRKETQTPTQVEGGVVIDRKKARSLQVEAGLIALIDGPAPIPHKLRQQLVAIADRLQDGDSVPQIAKRLRTNPTAINRLISKMRRAAEQQAATYPDHERESEGQHSPTYTVPFCANNNEINVLQA